MAASLLEKVMSVLNSPCSLLGNPGDIILVVNICLVYFLAMDLELPPPGKPPTMALTLKCGTLYAILNGDGCNDNERGVP